MLQEVTVGELQLIERQIIELANTFDDQFTEVSARLVEKARDLHSKENAYRTAEDKLIQMIIEYRELVQHDDDAQAD